MAEIDVTGNLKFLKLNSHCEVIFATKGVNGFMECIGILKPLPEAHIHHLIDDLNKMCKHKGYDIKIFSKPLYACESFFSNLIHKMLNKRSGMTWTTIMTI